MLNLLNKTTMAIGTMLVGIASVSAGTLLDTTTYGGHTYELWDSYGINWASASAAATAEGGYLAVFTTQSETETVFGVFFNQGFFAAGGAQQNQAWLGARPADGSSSTTNPNNWQWVTGEAWTAFDQINFNPGEPNGDSSALAINRRGSSKWNDETSLVGGYIVEKNGIRGVPDSGSSVMLLGGVVAMLSAIRSKFAGQA